MNATTANQVIKLNVASEASVWHHHVRNLTPIVMLYLGLAFYRIDSQSLWTDEVWSVSESLLAGPASWTELNSMSPLYFILLGIWSKLVGSTEFALRAFSALLGVASVCITYAIADKLFNRRTAVFAAILLATSPYVIWFAQEVRYISLTLVTSLMMTYAFHRAISGGSWKWWSTYVATSIMALFSFVTVIFLIGVHGLYVLCCASHRPMLRKWLAHQTVTLLLFGVFLIGFGLQSRPNLATVFSQAPAVTSQAQTRSRKVLPMSDVVGIIPYTFYVFSVGFSLGPSVRELHVSRSIAMLVNHIPTIITVTVFFATVFLVGLKSLRQNRKAAIFLVAWLFIPILGTFLVATTTTFNVYNTRYVALSLPAYLLILASGISGIRPSIIQFLILGTLLISNGVSLGNYYFDTEYVREDARSAAKYMELVEQPRDIILLNGHPKAFQYYYKGDLAIVTVARHSTKNTLPTADNLPEVTNDTDRIWLVEIRSWQTDPKGEVKATLDKQARLDKHQSFPGVQIYSYQPTDRGS